MGTRAASGPVIYGQPAAIADRFGQLTCCPLCAISNDLPAYVFAWIAQVSESRRSRSQWLMLPSCVRKGGGCALCFPSLRRHLRYFRVAAIGFLRFLSSRVGHGGKHVADQFDLGGELHGGLGAYILKRRTPVALTFSALKAD